VDVFRRISRRGSGVAGFGDVCRRHFDADTLAALVQGKPLAARIEIDLRPGPAPGARISGPARMNSPLRALPGCLLLRPVSKRPDSSTIRPGSTKQ